ncbi:MAG: glutamate--cysteine ligase [Pseudomonadales bacterium]
MRLTEHTLQVLRSAGSGLDQLQRGIEKESLRVARDGSLSLRPHPKALGSALTHSAITTDFSEAQLELITGVHDSPEGCLDELSEIHHYVHTHLDNELLWPSSMPCILGTENESIPIGQYGHSNIGLTKTVYRRGLGHRYGRLMQTISGIHYNFSVPDALWQHLGITKQTQRTEAYFSLIRNFRRNSWLLIYLFGASPAVCKSFLQRPDHGLEALSDGTFYLPFATSLRMGRLGYQSDAQSELHISYNSLEEYAATMRSGLTTSYADYADIPVNKNGDYQQLNDSILQIENEFYGTIRPKRSAASGQRPLAALGESGVEYIEVRCVDLDPFEPIGINSEQIRFLDTFLLLCLLTDSPTDSREESARMVRNQTAVVERGRQPGLALERDNESVELNQWAAELLDQCTHIAEVLDQHAVNDAYSQALNAQKAKVQDPELTPSARVIATLNQGQSFFEFTMQNAEQHAEFFANRTGNPAQQAELQTEANNSLARQLAIEEADSLSFPDFVRDYLSI